MARITKAAADELLQQAYNQYGNLLMKYCSVRLKDVPESIEDCVQNTFLTYYNKVLGGEEVEKPKAFLYRIADNMIKREIAEFYKKAQRTVDLKEADEIPVDSAFDSTADIDYDYLKEILISKLSEEEQRLYEQKYVQRMSLRQLSSYYGINAAAVANRTSRLRTKIKSLINQVIKENGKGGDEV